MTLCLLHGVAREEDGGGGGVCVCVCDQQKTRRCFVAYPSGLPYTRCNCVYVISIIPKGMPKKLSHNSVPDK
jgi:hypothetical protein